MILSICSGMGLLDRAFMDTGFDVLPGCEIDPDQRLLYHQLCDGEPMTYDIKDLVSQLKKTNYRFSGVIGGPPCQSHTVLKARWHPKYPDLTPQVNEILDIVKPEWYLFENVVPLDIPGSKSIKMDAMHFAKPHQSRPRWFTYSENLQPPGPQYAGTINDLMAYPAVYGKLYGPKRAAVLQGYPEAAKLKAPSIVLQKGLSNAVHYGVAKAWAKSIKQSIVAA